MEKKIEREGEKGIIFQGQFLSIVLSLASSSNCFAFNTSIKRTR